MYNSGNRSYTQYSYVYQATSTKTTLIFCFVNQYNFWALDDVSMKDSQTNSELLVNGGFESGTWSPWVYFLTVYYASGMSSNYNSWNARSNSYFYVDVQYNKTGDGIYQNVTTVLGRNYTISFYLANPRGSNFSAAIVSVGP